MKNLAATLPAISYGENGELVEVEYSQQQCEKAFAWMNDEEDDLLLGIEADEIKNG